MSVDNINGLNGQAPQRSGDSSKPATTESAVPEKAGAAIPKPGGADSVSLTDTAAQLRRIEASLGDLPEVDEDRVAAIRRSIEDGSYQVDATRIADVLLQFESSLDK